MSKKVLFSLIFSFACLSGLLVSAWGQSALPPIDPAKLTALDIDPQLANQTGEDRLLKYVLRTAAEGDSAVVVNRQYLDRNIAESLQDGTAMVLMGQDINHGDTRLRTALMGVFQSFNYNPAQIQDIFHRWAAGQSPEVARAVLENTANEPNAMRFLSAYILDTPNNWAQVLNNALDVENGKLALTPNMLQNALVNSELLSSKEAAQMIASAAGGDLDARASLADLVIKLQTYRGTVARYLEGVGTTPASWYGHVYGAMITQIAQDPLYLSDYAKRSALAQSLYDAWGRVSEDAMSSNDKDFFVGYYSAASLPNSRFAIVVSDMLGDQGMQQRLGTDANQIAETLKAKTISSMQSDPKALSEILWQLTRPAEVLCLAIRQALPSVLSNDQALALQFAQQLPRIGGLFNSQLRDTSAFSYYNNDPAEFRRRLQDNKLTVEGLKQFGQQAGQLLAVSDSAWKTFFAGNGANDNLTRLLCQGAIGEDRATAIYLIRTIEGNDDRLYRGFGSWLITTRKTHDMDAYGRWLDAVVRNLETNSAVGNTDVANFKAWFADYLKTPDGWGALSNRLAIESTLINEPLRDSIATFLTSNPDRLWKLLGLIGATNGDTTVTVRQKLEYYVIAGHVNEVLLRQVAAQNQIAADATYPVWGELLRSNSPTIVSIQKTVEDGTVLNDLAAVVIQSLIDVISQTNYQQILDQPMRQMTGLDASISPNQVVTKAQEMLTYQAPKCTDFFKAAFDNPQVAEAWRTDFLNQVRLNGKAYVVADHLKRNPELQVEWGQLVSVATTQDVTLWRQILLALVYRQVASEFSENGPTDIYYNLSRILVEDRVMFEQLLASPGGSYRADYQSAVQKQVGGLAAQAWMGLSQKALAN